MGITRTYHSITIHYFELNPKQADLYTNRGDAWLGKGNLQQAIADYTQAIEIDPGYLLAYSNRGLARLLQGKQADARSP